jgi:hypothetical protein
VQLVHEAAPTSWWAASVADSCVMAARRARFLPTRHRSTMCSPPCAASSAQAQTTQASLPGHSNAMLVLMIWAGQLRAHVS